MEGLSLSALQPVLLCNLPFPLGGVAPVLSFRSQINNYVNEWSMLMLSDSIMIRSSLVQYLNLRRIQYEEWVSRSKELVRFKRRRKK
eukprot:scaffold185824_cov47-Attheya_sp.AAC.7